MVNIFCPFGYFNPFLASVPILYSLKIPENLQGIENENIGQKSASKVI